MLAADAEADDADLLIVLTTRLNGYSDLNPDQFERVDLGYMLPADAMRYGELAVRARYRGDQERVTRVLNRLALAANDDSLRDLLLTPLQVLILTIIIDSTGRVPPGRFALFNGYYDAIYKRERNKSHGYARILQEFGPHVDRLHEAVGLRLHVLAETGGDSNATLTIDEVRQLAGRVLADAKYEPSGRDRELLDDIVRAATHRLVLIAPRPDDGGYGFDVRSLQELMAARMIAGASHGDTLKCLQLLSASPHWRNVWIFAAGRLFDFPQEQPRAAIVQLVEAIDDDAPHRLSKVVPIGPMLALDLISDGMARAFPEHRGRLLAHALRILDEPADSSILGVARTLIRHAQAGDEQRSAVSNGLRNAMTRTPTSRDTTQMMMKLMPNLFDELEVSVQVRGLAAVVPRPESVLPVEADPDERWAAFDEEVETAPLKGSSRLALQAAGDVLRRVADGSPADLADQQAIYRALDDSETSAALVDALVHVLPATSRVLLLLRDFILEPIYRQPRGELLRTIFPGV